MHPFATFDTSFLAHQTYFKSSLDFKGIFVNCSTEKKITT